MKISILGDSLSTFYSCCLPDYAVFYTAENAMMNGLSGTEDIWWHQVMEMLGGELLINGAYSGSRVSGTEFPASSSYQRIKALQTNSVPDCILVHIGHNDYGFNVPLGLEENSLNYFYPAYIAMFHRLKEIYPDTRIICSTLMKTYVTFHDDWHLPEKNQIGVMFDDYNQAIRKACEECRTELADLAETGILYETLDGSHGTAKGHREIAHAWKKALAL